MSMRFKGGIISATPPTTTAYTASGAWTLQQQMQAQGSGLWPAAGGYNLFVWGQNNTGQLGQNNLIYKSSPVQVGAGPAWTTVSMGYRFCLGVKNNGTLWAWGQNNGGRLGDGTTVSKSSPIQIGSASNWWKVSAGGSSSIAIKTDGTLWAWGYNGSGQLGQNDTVNRSSPVQIGSDTDWASVSLGNNFVAAIKTNGTLWTWGRNNKGQLGRGTSGIAYNLSSPTQLGALTTWTTAACGSQHMGAIKSGQLWMWGDGSFGKLGLTNTNYYSSPKQVGSLTTWRSLSCAYFNTAAVKTDNTMWAFGGNQYYQLPKVSPYSFNSPIQVGSDFSISMSLKHVTFGVKTNGTLWGGGESRYGSLGNNSIGQFGTFQQIGALTTWKTNSSELGLSDSAAFLRS